MKKIRLLNLGTVTPLRSQTCYHAAAEALVEGAPDTIIMVSPASPYVCVGYHQDLDREVDLAYCQSRGWPVYRREVGGGAVYLDSGQVFIQWIFQPSSLPAAVEDRFRMYIEPIVRTYRALGIAAEFRPINDIQVKGKKIGGTGAAAIGRAEVLVGSLMFDFDKAAMARVLKVASEKMRDKIHQSLEQYMTTMGEELGLIPERDTVIGIYLSACAEVLGAEIVPGAWSEEEENLATVIDRRFVTPGLARTTQGDGTAGSQDPRGCPCRGIRHQISGRIDPADRPVAQRNRGRIDHFGGFHDGSEDGRGRAGEGLERCESKRRRYPPEGRSRLRSIAHRIARPGSFALGGGLRRPPRRINTRIRETQYQITQFL